MLHNPQRVHELTLQIETLEPEDRLELLRRVLTPETELRLLVEELSGRARGHDPRALARDVNAAVRAARG